MADLAELEDGDVEGISASPVSDASIFTWRASIAGKSTQLVHFESNFCSGSSFDFVCVHATDFWPPRRCCFFLPIVFFVRRREHGMGGRLLFAASHLSLHLSALAAARQVYGLDLASKRFRDWGSVSRHPHSSQLVAHLHGFDSSDVDPLAAGRALLRFTSEHRRGQALPDGPQGIQTPSAKMHSLEHVELRQQRE